jgi:hypothetical protein
MCPELQVNRQMSHMSSTLWFSTHKNVDLFLATLPIQVRDSLFYSSVEYESIGVGTSVVSPVSGLSGPERRRSREC